MSAAPDMGVGWFWVQGLGSIRHAVQGHLAPARLASRLGVQQPRGGLRIFQQKSTCLDAIDVQAVCGTTLVKFRPGIWEDLSVATLKRRLGLTDLYREGVDIRPHPGTNLCENSRP